MKCIEKIRKTHTFSLKIEVKMMNNNGGFSEKHGRFERGSNGEDNDKSQKFEGKPKCFKKTDQIAQNTRFL